MLECLREYSIEICQRVKLQMSVINLMKILKNDYDKNTDIGKMLKYGYGLFTRLYLSLTIGIMTLLFP